MSGGLHRNLKAAARQAVGYLVAAVCLVWVFHGIHLGTLLRRMGDIRWRLIPLAVAFDILSYLCQGIRWKLLLHRTAPIPAVRATRAIYAGLFANELLPFRAGELVRAYLVSRWQKRDLLSIVPSMVVERLFDGIWLAIGIGLTAVFVRLPRNLVEAADVFGAVVLAATVVFISLVVRRKRSLDAGPPARRERWKPIEILHTMITRVAEGIRDIGASRRFYLSLLVSSLIIVFQILSFWLVMESYGLRLSLWVGAAVFLIVHFGTALPNAPSNIGTYQFFTVLGLALFGVDKTTAAGFSVSVFIILTAPLWVIGLLAVGSTGMHLGEIRREIGALLTKPRIPRTDD